MYQLIKNLFLGITFFAALISCTTSPVREVASKSTSPVNTERQRNLKQAADAGILFLITDNVFKDGSTKQIGTCKKRSESAWAENVFEVLSGLAQAPFLYNKFHILEVRRGSEAKAFLEKEEDGSVRLVLSYARRTTFEKITPFTELPCSQVSSEYVNRDLEVTNYEWPSKESAIAALSSAEAKAELAKFNFDKKFLTFLADKMTVLKFSNETLAEKNSAGEYALTQVLNKLAEEISSQGNYKNIEFWLREINLKSQLANNLEFFALNKDLNLAYGIRVDSSGKMSRKINNSSDPTYMQLSYRPEGMNFLSPQLKELEACLANLTQVYKSSEFVKNFDSDKEGYLYPGYPCRAKEEVK